MGLRHIAGENRDPSNPSSPSNPSNPSKALPSLPERNATAEPMGARDRRCAPSTESQRFDLTRRIVTGPAVRTRRDMDVFEGQRALFSKDSGYRRRPPSPDVTIHAGCTAPGPALGSAGRRSGSIDGIGGAAAAALQTRCTIPHGLRVGRPDSGAPVPGDGAWNG
jgi:hypothetical protein